MKLLNERLEQLNSRKGDIELRIKAELSLPRKMVKKEVELWLKSVTNFNDEIKEIQGEYRQVKCFSRARIGKKSH